MPTLEQKTPVYDVLIWLAGEDKPVTVRNHLVKDDALAVMQRLTTQGFFWYNKKKNNKAVLTDVDRWVNKASIVSCQMDQCFDEVYRVDDSAYGSWGYTEQVPVYLEDLEIDCE